MHKPGKVLDIIISNVFYFSAANAGVLNLL